MSRLDRLRGIVAGSSTSGVRSATLLQLGGACNAHTSSRGLEVLDGTLEQGPDGPSFVIRRTYEAAAPYGRWRLGDYPVQSLEALEMLAGRTGKTDESGDPRQVVCLDLETTGLRGGAGTVGFIVGLGWFDAGAFQTCQYFLSGLADERRLLSAVAEILRPAHTIITFNGSSFDVPVMETRYAFHRFSSPTDVLRHVDMLYPSRHLWTVDEGRLVNLERTVLGLRRTGDVPGAEIPRRYVGYLQGGDARLLAPVLEHNRLDLVSLGALAGLACQLVRHGPEATINASQALGLGRIYEKAGRTELAVACYQRAAGIGQPDIRAMSGWTRSSTFALEAPARALCRLARAFRRRRRYADAADAWVRLLRLLHVPDGLRREASVALAMHHEHRLHDLSAAQQFAGSALEAESHPMRRQAVQHRLTRLRRKLNATKIEANRGFLQDEL